MKRCLKKSVGALSLIVVTCVTYLTIFAVNYIGDPMLLKAINNSIKEYFPNRDEAQEILEADIPYVLSLNASGLGVADISGIEQFTYIESTIDLSNNNITDITPLINWFKNKGDEQLSTNIFLGGNPVLLNDNYKQLYTLIQMGENVRIYDSKRNGTGVIELTGFVNGRPVDIDKFDNESVEDGVSDVEANSSLVEEPKADKAPINTGLGVSLIYIFLGVTILFICFKYVNTSKI